MVDLEPILVDRQKRLQQVKELATAMEQQKNKLLEEGLELQGAIKLLQELLNIKTP